MSPPFSINGERGPGGIEGQKKSPTIGWGCIKLSYEVLVSYYDFFSHLPVSTCYFHDIITGWVVIGRDNSIVL
jgi:hypothetical protein